MSDRAEAARRVREFLAAWNQWMRVPGDGGKIRKVTRRDKWDQKVEFTLTAEDLAELIVPPRIFVSIGDSRVEIPVRQERGEDLSCSLCRDDHSEFECPTLPPSRLSPAPQPEPSSDPPPSKPQPDDARQ